MTRDQPPAGELLDAMARTLSDVVVPDTSGASQHAARVVANLCRVLAREVATVDGADRNGVRDELARILGRQGSEVELIAALDERLRDGDERFDRQAWTVLMNDVERRLLVARPAYVEQP